MITPEQALTTYRAGPEAVVKEGLFKERLTARVACMKDFNVTVQFRFITTPGLGPTNNLAEQAVRFVVIDRRVTQGTRSEKGRETCERLWTEVGTCAMQGRSAFELILAAVRAYLQNQPAPSLLPVVG